MRGLSNTTPRHRPNYNFFGVEGLGEEGSTTNRVTIIFDADGVNANFARRKFSREAAVYVAGDLDRQLGTRPPHRDREFGGAAAVHGHVKTCRLVDGHKFQMTETQRHPTRVRDVAYEGAARNRLAIELYVDVVGFGGFRGKRHQATTTTHDLYMVGDFAFVYRDFELTLTSSTRIH